MRILALSDVRTQPMAMLVRAVEQHRPDLILYGGDDVQRFGEVSQRAVAEAAVRCVSAAGARTGEIASRLGVRGLVRVLPFDEQMDPRSSMARARVVLLGSSFRAAAFPSAALGLVSYTVDEVTEGLLELGLLDRMMSKTAPPWSALPEDQRLRRFNRMSERIEIVEDGGEAWAVYVLPDLVSSRLEGSWTELARRAPLGLAGVIGNDCHPLCRSILAQVPCHDLDAGLLLLSDGWAVLGLGGAPSRTRHAWGCHGSGSFRP